ncbi:hypothetical protein HT594_00117 [Phenacoccus solenopsis nudivirus]|nr:hypothetical protein HT594_00117 [Phenacoccus solenopsis nudivirus]
MDSFQRYRKNQQEYCRESCQSATATKSINATKTTVVASTSYSAAITANNTHRHHYDTVDFSKANGKMYFKNVPIKTNRMLVTRLLYSLRVCDSTNTSSSMAVKRDDVASSDDFVVGNNNCIMNLDSFERILRISEFDECDDVTRQLLADSMTESRLSLNAFMFVYLLYNLETVILIMSIMQNVNAVCVDESIVRWLCNKHRDVLKDVKYTIVPKPTIRHR